MINPQFSEMLIECYESNYFLPANYYVDATVGIPTGFAASGLLNIVAPKGSLWLDVRPAESIRTGSVHLQNFYCAFV
jgi:hypothetical protein